MIADERWASIPNREGYEASTHGRVRSVERLVVDRRGHRRVWPGQLLTPEVTQDGHLRAKLARHGRMFVHRAVLEAFVGPCPDGMQGCHKDGDPSNNRLSNVRWDTGSANTYDMIRHGRHHKVRRERCPLDHALAEPNLIPYRLERGSRICRACRYGAREGNRLGLAPDVIVALKHDYYRRIMATPPGVKLQRRSVLTTPEVKRQKASAA